MVLLLRFRLALAGGPAIGVAVAAAAGDEVALVKPKRLLKNWTLNWTPI
jgi:hypothetical protein